MAYVEPNIPVVLSNLLMDAMVDHLAVVMIDDAQDDVQAGLVRAGLLQSDPTRTRITLLVHPGDESWAHELNTKTYGPDLHAPTYEIGGGIGAMFMRRRFIVELSLFFHGETYRLRAQQKAMAVLHRAIHALWTMPIPSYTDDFGESAQSIQIASHYLTEGGGTSEYIWRGEIKVEFLTHLDPA